VKVLLQQWDLPLKMNIQINVSSVSTKNEVDRYSKMLPDREEFSVLVY